MQSYNPIIYAFLGIFEQLHIKGADILSAINLGYCIYLQRLRKLNTTDVFDYLLQN